jgi:hypothetical protein
VFRLLQRGLHQAVQNCNLLLPSPGWINVKWKEKTLPIHCSVKTGRAVSEEQKRSSEGLTYRCISTKLHGFTFHIDQYSVSIIFVFFSLYYVTLVCSFLSKADFSKLLSWYLSSLFKPFYFYCFFLLFSLFLLILLPILFYILCVLP